MERMNLEEKLEFFKVKGFTYNSETGDIISHKGNILKSKTQGYIFISTTFENNKEIRVRGHILAWYLYYNCLPLGEIDHIDRVRDNNKINNLRDLTKHKNIWNCDGLGYEKHGNKYRARIGYNNFSIKLGSYDTKEEARQAYLEAKKIYHII